MKARINKETVEFKENQESKMLWYAVSTYENLERKVLRDLIAKLKQPGFAEYFTDAIIVSETVETVKKLKKGDKIVSTEVMIHPGYVYIKCMMTDLVWYLIRNQSAVKGIIGSSGKGAKPNYVREDEMRPILIMIDRTDLLEEPLIEATKEVEPVIVKESVSPRIKIGDSVFMHEGPFKGEKANVLELITREKMTKIKFIESGQILTVSMSSLIKKGD